MAGVYIPGMEMPESCYYCPFADGVWQKDKRCLINGEKMPRDGRDVQQNHINCPLVPVPEHGRLVDESKISLAEYEQAAHDALHNGKGSILYDCGVLDGARAITRLVRNAPTVIPAEEGEER